VRRAATGAALVAALALTATGCSGGTQIGSSSAVVVYVSMPMRGPSGADGRDVADGARMALAQVGGKAGGLTVRAVYLDDTRGKGSAARWSAAQVGANARKATEDSTSIAYIGDFESGATRTSEPITNEARLLQVSPASSAVDLTRPFAGSEQLPVYEQAANGRTFGRVIPDDDAQGRAAARWVKELGGTDVEIQRSGTFGNTLASAFRSALAGTVSVNKPGVDLLYVASDGVESQSIAQHFRGPILASDAFLPPFAGKPAPLFDFATSAALDPSQLPPAGQKFVRDFRARYGREPGRYATYGYEAMAVVLDSIDRAASDTISRQAVIDAFFNTVDRQSILGAYSIDSVGDTSLDHMTGFRAAANGALRPVAILSAR